jgi:hypothetical protein
MTKTTYPALASIALAGLVGLAACATVGDNAPTAVRAPGSVQFNLGDITTDDTPELGKLKICVDAGSNASASFSALRAQFGNPASQPGYAFQLLASASVDPGKCLEIADDNGGNLIGSNVQITETTPGLASVSGLRIDADPNGGPSQINPLSFVNGGTLPVNSYHGMRLTFAIHVIPPQVCDFITFGRLVTESGGQKVVISGNAGGNKPGGGILGEFHVEVNGVDNHVADIDTYGPITSGALSGPSFPNARVVTGTAKNGVKVELRLWDGGEPGKNTDKVWVRLDGTVVLPTAFIDQGNMQYHPECRGPK